MMVTFQIPGPLVHLTGGRRQVPVDASPATLAGAFEALWILYPGLRDRVLTEQGQIRDHINVFIGSEDVRYMGELNAPIPPSAEVSILPAISGG